MSKEVKRFFHFIAISLYVIFSHYERKDTDILTVKFHISLPKRVIPTDTVTTGHPNVVRFSLKGNNPSDVHLPAAKTSLHIDGCVHSWEFLELVASTQS